MRRLQELVSYIPVLLLGIALGSTLNNWSYLSEVGGWFALLGHFVSVAATLVMIYIAGVLVVAVLAAPIIILFSMQDDDSFALTRAMHAPASPRTLLATCRRSIARALMAVAEPVWKALWWCWWFVSSRDAADTTANDG